MSNEKNKRVKRYRGEQVEVTWDRRLCIHVAECDRAAGELFVFGRDPWCVPDVTDVGGVAEVIERCPSGALAYHRKDGGPGEEAPAKNVVMVSNHGPLYVHGQLEIEGATDELAGVKFRAALCRCGQSKKKPFCDNAHEKAGFRDRGAVGRSGAPLEETGGPLEISATENGPLVLRGNLEIHASSGRVAWQGRKAVLCRCGQSKNKPFCDDSHKAAGFKAGSYDL